MKKLYLKLIFLVVLQTFPVSLSAYDFEADGFYFNITDAVNNEVEVTYKDTNYKSYSGVIDIPSTVLNDNVSYTVTAIGAGAFRDCGTLPSVKIPNTVKIIGDYAFYRCANIYSLTVGSNVQTIGTGAFYKYYESSNSSSNSLIPIKKAIWLCNTLPSGVSYLYNDRFKYRISASTNYVSSEQLELSSKKVYPFLSSRFEVDNVVYVPISPSDRTCDVIDCSYEPTNGEFVIDSIVSNRGVQLKVLNINDYAFYNNDKITTLKISNAGCIGERASYDCDALTTVTLSNNGHLGSYAFYDCDALTTVTLSNNGHLGSYAFYDCDNLTTATISNNGYIGSYAFYSCDALQTVNASNREIIYQSAFQNCSSLTQLEIGDKVKSLDYNCFSGCSKLPKVIIPDNITFLGSYVFQNCSSLENVEIGNGIDVIPTYAFSGCSSLPDIKIPINIYQINNNAFTGCKSLSDVTIDKYQNEPQYFDDWTGNSKEIKEYEIGIKAGDCLIFTLKTKHASNYGKTITAYIDGEEVAYADYNSSQTYTKLYPSDARIILKIVVGQNDSGMITDLGLNIAPLTLGSNGSSPLFADCPLDEVYIGKKLSYQTSSDYGYSPFYRNTSLRSVKITDAETQIYDNEFYGCSNLQEFECGDGVESIGNWAFSGCSALKSYSSGSNVKTIGQEAFSDCTAMTSFTTLAAEPPVCGDQALDDINKWECTLHVPEESIDEYQAAPQWKEFFFIESSGVEDVVVDDDNNNNDDAPVYYNLQGVRVDNPSAGIYIVRRGNKTTKEYVN